MSDLTSLLFKPFEKFEATVGECSELITRERDARVRAETANRQKDELLIIVAHEGRCDKSDLERADAADDSPLQW